MARARARPPCAAARPACAAGDGVRLGALLRRARPLLRGRAVVAGGSPHRAARGRRRRLEQLPARDRGVAAGEVSASSAEPRLDRIEAAGLVPPAPWRSCALGPGDVLQPRHGRRQLLGDRGQRQVVISAVSRSCARPARQHHGAPSPSSGRAACRARDRGSRAARRRGAGARARGQRIPAPRARVDRLHGLGQRGELGRQRVGRARLARQRLAASRRAAPSADHATAMAATQSPSASPAAASSSSSCTTGRTRRPRLVLRDDVDEPLARRLERAAADAAAPARGRGVRPSACSRRASDQPLLVVGRELGAARARRRPAPSTAARTPPRRTPRPPPGPTIDASARPPRTKPTDCVSIVLPAPVSPVTTLRPGARSSSARSIRTRLDTNRRSITARSVARPAANVRSTRGNPRRTLRGMDSTAQLEGAASLLAMRGPGPVRPLRAAPRGRPGVLGRGAARMARDRVRGLRSRGAPRGAVRARHGDAARRRRDHGPAQRADDGGPGPRDLHRFLARAMAPRVIEPLRPSIRALAEQLLDELEPEGVVELWERFASPLPVSVVARLLGLQHDREMLARSKAWMEAVLAWRHTYGEDPEIVEAATVAARASVHDLLPTVRARRDEPADDLISELWRVGPTILPDWSEEDVLDQCRVLFEAGSETTSHLIGTCVALLAADEALERRVRPRTVHWSVSSRRPCGCGRRPHARARGAPGRPARRRHDPRRRPGTSGERLGQPRPGPLPAARRARHRPPRLRVAPCVQRGPAALRRRCPGAPGGRRGAVRGARSRASRASRPAARAAALPGLRGP